MTNLQFRVDFRLVNVASKNESPRYVPVPDPDRYEFGQMNGEDGWFDRLDSRRLFFPQHVIDQMLERAAKMPLGDLRPLISDSNAYIAGRKEAIRRNIDEEHSDDAFRNAADEELAVTSEERTNFVIVSIDLVGSTLLSQKIDSNEYARIIQTFSKEVALLCGLFHGRPLKFMGDGAILYFPFGGPNRKHDLALDCALSLRDLVLVGLNEVLEERGLPKLSCRIGIDSGDAHVIMIGDRATTSHRDIIGQVVNIAAKLEKAAPINGICIGESVAINAHTMWLKNVKPSPQPERWPYRHAGTDEPYCVFLLDM